mmetsp:Transcript_1089/g.2889  ORF Transcript_1089/g.2889 Transcript_1089/m.2889 type:complete len:222 (+) Transcript_1089:53-718(+)
MVMYGTKGRYRSGKGRNVSPRNGRIGLAPPATTWSSNRGGLRLFLSLLIQHLLQSLDELGLSHLPRRHAALPELELQLPDLHLVRGLGRGLASRRAGGGRRLVLLVVLLVLVRVNHVHGRLLDVVLHELAVLIRRSRASRRHPHRRNTADRNPQERVKGHQPGEPFLGEEVVQQQLVVLPRQREPRQQESQRHQQRQPYLRPRHRLSCHPHRKSSLSHSDL